MSIWQVRVNAVEPNWRDHKGAHGKGCAPSRKIDWGRSGCVVHSRHRSLEKAVIFVREPLAFASTGFSRLGYIDATRQKIIELSGGRDAIKARPPEWLNK